MAAYSCKIIVGCGSRKNETINIFKVMCHWMYYLWRTETLKYDLLKVFGVIYLKRK